MEFLDKIYAFIMNFIETIKNLVSGVRDMNDKKDEDAGEEV